MSTQQEKVRRRRDSWRRTTAGVVLVSQMLLSANALPPVVGLTPHVVNPEPNRGFVEAIARLSEVTGSAVRLDDIEQAAIDHPALAAALVPLLAEVANAWSSVRVAIEGVTEGHIQAFIDWRRTSGGTGYGVAKDGAVLEPTALTENAAPFDAAIVDIDTLVKTRDELVEAVEAFMAALETMRGLQPPLQPAGHPNWVMDLPPFLVVFDAPPVLCANHVHTAVEDGYIIVIDGCGNDQWTGMTAATTIAMPLKIVIDGDGQDVYNFAGGAVTTAQAVAFPGVALLIDRGQGDDQYTVSGGAFTVGQGAGILGSAMLKDHGGDDTYTLGGTDTTLGQGFGSAGTGTLRDFQEVLSPPILQTGGSDTYVLTGLGTPAGGGVVGADTVCAGQGYGEAGGVGALFDSGNAVTGGLDSFTVTCTSDGAFADLRVQGAGVLGGGGNLVNTMAVQPAEGLPVGAYGTVYLATATSNQVAVNANMEVKGFARTLAQGAGGGFGTGFLRDAAGDDVYTATASGGMALVVAQGSGDQGGWGTLFEDSGSDDMAATANATFIVGLAAADVAVFNLQLINGGATVVAQGSASNGGQGWLSDANSEVTGFNDDVRNATAIAEAQATAFATNAINVQPQVTVTVTNGPATAIAQGSGQGFVVPTYATLKDTKGWDTGRVRAKAITTANAGGTWPGGTAAATATIAGAPGGALAMGWATADGDSHVRHASGDASGASADLYLSCASSLWSTVQNGATTGGGVGTTWTPTFPPPPAGTGGRYSNFGPNPPAFIRSSMGWQGTGSLSGVWAPCPWP